MNIEELRGKVLLNIKNKNDEELIFTATDGEVYKLYHVQDCCEEVTIADIFGDLDDILGSPILIAEEIQNSINITPKDAPAYDGGFFTWTFYKLDTAKGGVTIRWYGSSSGDYSVAVAFERVK